MKNLDWRFAVERIAIDLNYDTGVNGGDKTFHADIIDMPQTVIDYVEGSYKVPHKKVVEVVAVKITDILGESIILSKMFD